ncbi:hypothetical protein AUK40_01300 [Candidatus Wirthbacteria bacterium CG2_30_54_11]|uniref:SpoVT-AbrB domain-containing protein n=1 Tax=Candidatus Wirthbacteria bacterium CG2_30_54_11 TaxID=1817892 RepID=A0A1J5IZN1_9BACT|nr:MAG: hypothetical protein AUK40_01300 [Candidatus Wirthbacteria bacterium CG2_30_54_11]
MERKFFGTTTVGERGQVVIPSEAREAMGLEKGEKLLVFGMHSGTVMLAKLETFKQMSKEMERRNAEVQKILEEN